MSNDKNLAVAYNVRRKNKRKMMAEGGDVKNRKRESREARVYSAQNSEKGINTPRSPYPGHKDSYGESSAGYSAKGSLNDQAKRQHENTLNEMRSMKKPNLYAEGGMIDEEMPDSLDLRADDDMMDDDGDEMKTISEMIRSKAIKMARGGMIDEEMDSPSAMVQKRMGHGIDDNAIEHVNEYDELNKELGDSEMYPEQSALDEIDLAHDDNGQDGDEIDSDEHDMVSKIRRKYSKR